MSAHAKPLGRNVPPDREHELKYPISALALDARPTRVPVPAGTNWYGAMDTPTKGTDGRYRVRHTRLGSIRGGHCYCFEPLGEPDPADFWRFFDQADEGACEGFGHARAMALLQGELMDAFWLYDDAQRIEGTYLPDGGSADEGSTNRSACAALKRWGVHPEGAELAHVPVVIEREPWRMGVPSVGISAYHWASSVDEIVAALGFPSSAVELPILNSWGRNGYPHRVYLPLELIERLRSEEGEYSVLTPR